jgi:hypothetical protein
MDNINLKAIPDGATVISGDPTEVGAQLFVKLTLPVITAMHEKGGPDVSMGVIAGLLGATFCFMSELYGRERGAHMARMAAASFEEAQARAVETLKH